MLWTQQFEGSKKEKGKWKQALLGGACKGRWKVLIRSEGCGLVLRIPCDTESDAAVVGVVGQEVAALRRAAVVGVVVPDAAANQTGNTSSGSGGVGHASG